MSKKDPKAPTCAGAAMNQGSHMSSDDINVDHFPKEIRFFPHIYVSRSQSRYRLKIG